MCEAQYFPSGCGVFLPSHIYTWVADLGGPAYWFEVWRAAQTAARDLLPTGFNISVVNGVCSGLAGEIG